MKEALDKPTRAQDRDAMVTSILEGGKDIQGGESGGGDQGISGK